MMAITGDLNRGFKINDNLKSSAQHNPSPVNYCPYEEEDSFNFNVDDDSEFGGSGNDIFPWFDDPMDSLYSRAQHISPTRLSAIRRAHPPPIVPRTRYPRAIRCRSRVKAEPLQTRLSRYSNYRSTPKKPIKDSDYMDSFKNRYGDDDYVLTHSRKKPAGSGYRFPKQMPETIQQLMAFWENDFQVGEEVYPKMSSWEKMGIVSAMKKFQKDYKLYCTYENLVKEWLSGGKKEPMWNLNLTEISEILNCKRRKHYPKDAWNYSIDGCAVLEQSYGVSWMKDIYSGS